MTHIEFPDPDTGAEVTVTFIPMEMTHPDRATRWAFAAEVGNRVFETVYGRQATGRDWRLRKSLCDWMYSRLSDVDCNAWLQTGLISDEVIEQGATTWQRHIARFTPGSFLFLRYQDARALAGVIFREAYGDRFHADDYFDPISDRDMIVPQIVTWLQEGDLAVIAATTVADLANAWRDHYEGGESDPLWESLEDGA